MADYYLSRIKIASIALILLIFLIIAINLPKFKEEAYLSPDYQVRGVVTNLWLDSSKLERLEEHRINYLFVDIGELNKNGIVNSSSEEIISFLERVATYENSKGYLFIVLPYSRILMEEYNFSEQFEDNLIISYGNLIKLGFDGVYLDIEEVSIERREDYLEFVKKLRTNLTDENYLSVHSGILDNVWTKDFYEDISETADLIVIPSYGVGTLNEEEYRTYVSNQVKQLAKLDPYTKAKLVLEIPSHRNPPETIENSLLAYNKALDEIENTKFIGTSIYSEWTMDGNEWKNYKEFIE